MPRYSTAALLPHVPHAWVPCIARDSAACAEWFLAVVSCRTFKAGHPQVQAFSYVALCRLLASQKAAEKYIGQFPMPVLSHVAKFVAFLTGSFAALLLFVALIDDDLLERHLFGRNLVW